MPKGAFFSTRSTSGREGNSVLLHSKILEKYCDEIYFLTTTKTNKSKEIIEDRFSYTIKESIFDYTEHYQDVKTMSSWMEVYDSLDVSRFEDFSYLLLVGGIDLWRSNLTRGSNRNFVFPNDRGQLKFESTGKVLINVLALLKAHNEYDIPLHEINYDPNEMSYDLFHEDVSPKKNYHHYHGYDIPKYGMKRLDSNQCFLVKDMYTTEKSIDFVFGYTLLKKSEREHYKKYIDDLALNFDTAEIFTKNEYNGENTLLSRDEYIDKVSQAKYTFMLPSYDKHCFSPYRFIESLHQDCLPIIHPDCNITDVNTSFDVDLSELIVDRPFDDGERARLLSYYQDKFLTFKIGFANDE